MISAVKPFLTPVVNNFIIKQRSIRIQRVDFFVYFKYFFRQNPPKELSKIAVQ